jgi:hypothetical protein
MHPLPPKKMHLMNPKKKLLLARYEEETRANELVERPAAPLLAAAVSDAEMARQLQYEFNWGTRRKRGARGGHGGGGGGKGAGGRSFATGLL